MWHIFALCNIIGQSIPDLPQLHVYQHLAHKEALFFNSCHQVDRHPFNRPPRLVSTSLCPSYTRGLSCWIKRDTAKNKPFPSTGEQKTAESCNKRKEMPQTKGNTKKTKYQGSFQYKSSLYPIGLTKGHALFHVQNQNICFYCKVCKKTVSCSKQGICDVKVHTRTNMHQETTKRMKSQSTLF